MTNKQSESSTPSGQRPPVLLDRRRQRIVDRLSAVCIASPGATCIRLEAHVPPVRERCQSCTYRAIGAGRPTSSAHWARWLVRLDDVGGRPVAAFACDACVVAQLDALLVARALHRAHDAQLELFDADGAPARVDGVAELDALDLLDLDTPIPFRLASHPRALEVRS